MKKASVKLKYRPSKKAGKKGALVYQLIHERKVFRINSNHRIYNCEWDESSASIITEAADDERRHELEQVAVQVQYDLTLLAEIADRLASAGKPFSCEDVAEAFKTRSNRDSVFNFLKSQEERIRNLGHTRGGEILRTTLNRLVDFRRGVDMTFSMLDGNMMEQFEAYLKQRGLKRNTIGFYMRTLHIYYSIAVEEGLAADCRPFRKVFTGKDKTAKRALTIDEIKRIKELDLSRKPDLSFARDMLMFSFYARGMSFVDMAFLKKSDLQGDHFTYSRHKTGQTLCVEWIESMQQIVDKYPENETCHLLPIIKHVDKDERRQYLYQMKRVNRSLHEIGRMANVSGGMCTMYRARHSWATLARCKNVPIAIISEALGHDSEKTTEIYLNSIQSSVVDKVNRLLLKELN